MSLCLDLVGNAQAQVATVSEGLGKLGRLVQVSTRPAT